MRSEHTAADGFLAFLGLAHGRRKQQQESCKETYLGHPAIKTNLEYHAHHERLAQLTMAWSEGRR